MEASTSRALVPTSQASETDTAWQLVLRANTGRVVLYNADLSSFVIHNEPVDDAGRPDVCPLCGSTRRTSRSSSQRQPRPRNQLPETSYFDILDASSRAPSRPETPPLEFDSRMDDLSDALSQGYYERFFEEERLLGRGQRGAVYLAHHVLHGERLSTHAVKKQAVGSSAATLLATLKEVRHLSRLKHPKIIAYQHTWLEMASLSAFGPRVPTLFVLLEFANGGSLSSFISDRLSARLEREDSSASLSRGERIRARRPTGKAAIHHLRVDEILSLFEDIADGLAFLHDEGILHADLKSDNVLLHYDMDSTTPRALISDFGSSKPRSAQGERTGATGTIDWLPPETLKVDSRPQEMSTAVDLWALGLLLHTLSYLRLPWSVSDVDPLREEILKFAGFDARRPPMRRIDLPPTFLELMACLLSLDPSRRPKASTVLEQLRAGFDTPNEKAALVPARAVSGSPPPRRVVKIPPLDRLAVYSFVVLKSVAATQFCLLSPVGVNILLVSSLVEASVCVQRSASLSSADRTSVCQSSSSSPRLSFCFSLGRTSAPCKVRRCWLARPITSQCNSARLSLLYPVV